MSGRLWDLPRRSEAGSPGPGLHLIAGLLLSLGGPFPLAHAAEVRPAVDDLVTGKVAREHDGMSPCGVFAVIDSLSALPSIVPVTGDLPHLRGKRAA